jgi:sugar-specific transcriptional regulator TrmB
MDTSVLEELGLSKGEVKIYLTLLELGETKVGQVIEKSGMASSAVHNSLNILIDKGLISYIKKGKIKFYRAVPPKQIIDFIEEKKKKVLEILPELEIRQKKAKEKQEAEIFEGWKGITSLLHIMIEDAKKGDEYLFFSADVNEKNEEIQEFFRRYDLKRKEKGLTAKGLVPKYLKKLFIGRPLKIKCPNSPIPTNMAICNNNVAIISWEEKPIGYLINSNQIADIFRKFFYEIWDKTKS